MDALLWKYKGRNIVLFHTNMERTLGNYVRTYRKKAGLSQRELGRLLGYGDEGQVMRHELSRALPPLLIALGYEIIFRVPVSEIFAGLYEVVEQAVDRNIAELEEVLRQHNGKGSRAAATAHKLEWLRERRSRTYSLR
jgi:transcriptional regulator with XRE-family HTH domain